MHRDESIDTSLCLNFQLLFLKLFESHVA
jgi:hypothetical protein